jgi:ribonuclease P protein subunit POP4
MCCMFLTSEIVADMFPVFCASQLRRDSPNVGVDTVVQELLASNVKTASNIAGTIENRLLDRPYLLDNPATHGGAAERAKDRALRARSKRPAKHFSMRQHRQAGSFDLPAQYLKYDLFRPMHEMWESYARSLVAECNDASLQPRLLAADLHGAILAVVESKSTSYVGTQGIMIRETDQTFGIVTVQDKLRVVPKAGAVFMLQLDCLRITLFGNNLFSRQLHPRKQQLMKPTIEL